MDDTPEPQRLSIRDAQRGRLRKVRLEAPRRSQAQFAQQLGIKLRTYQSYESGSRDISVELLDALNRIENIQPLWIMRGVLPQRHPGVEPEDLAIQVAEDMDRSIEAAGLQPMSSAVRRMLHRRFVRMAFETGRSPTTEIEDSVRDYAGGRNNPASRARGADLAGPVEARS